MHPSSLLSYYPTYAILDEIISKNNYKNINIFMDLKNNLQTTYMEHAILNLIENTKRSKFIDTSIFTSVISFLSFHKIYALKRGININFFVFFESGHSYYHLNLSKKYKISRRIDDLYGLDQIDRDIFRKVLLNNFQLIEKACNKMPNITVTNLLNLEADFVPYYLITRNFVDNENSVNIIYSNDHDLLQCTNENTFVFAKSAKGKKIVKSSGAMTDLLKRECKLEPKYVPLGLSIVGDTGDDVDGVKGIGPKRFLDVFEDLMSISGGIENIYKNIQKSKPIFHSNLDGNLNKYTYNVIDQEEKIGLISMNLQLTSFELISRAVEDPANTEMLKRKKQIDNLFHTDKVVVKCQTIREALERNGVFLDGDTLENIYYRSQ